MSLLMCTHRLLLPQSTAAMLYTVARWPIVNLIVVPYCQTEVNSVKWKRKTSNQEEKEVLKNSSIFIVSFSFPV